MCFFNLAKIYLLINNKDVNSTEEIILGADDRTSLLKSND